jgi:hypothetical protein
MKHLAIAAIVGFALAGASTIASAQNAVVNQGSGAVNPLGTGESPGSAGIGGSGTSAPPSGMVTGSTVPRTVIVPAPGMTDSTGAVVNRGSGAVNPLGTGESSGSAGIGGSGTSAPRQ